MSTQEHESSLEERDQARRHEIATAEQALLQIVEQQRPTSLSELRAALEDAHLEMDSSLIRTALLRLLNANKLNLDDPTAVAG